jgi:uncharacterized protein with PQ loop repeat
MVHETHGKHHQHKRKRVHQKLEPYPHPNKFKNIMDKVVYVAGIFSIIITLPQLFDVWIGQNASGVSNITWGGYMILAVVWVLYGIAHKEKPIIFLYSSFVVIDLLVVIGTFIYG